MGSYTPRCRHCGTTSRIHSLDCPNHPDYRPKHVPISREEPRPAEEKPREYGMPAEECAREHGMSNEQIEARFRLCTLVMKLPDEALDDAETTLTRILSSSRAAGTVGMNRGGVRGPVSFRPGSKR